MEADFSSLQNHFLIAMPQLVDPHFGGALTYICEHNENGAMGIIVNKPSGIGLDDILEQLEVPSTGSDREVYAGGPVQMERGFILHQGTTGWKSTMKIADDIFLTTSMDILHAIGSGTGPEHYLVALGYAGWGAGQLEQELVDNSWLTCSFKRGILFDMPSGDRFNAAIASLGIGKEQLNSQIGHA